MGFELIRLDGGQSLKGEMMPMVAILTVTPPSENQHAHFGRHVDKETGVGPWFKPFTVEYDFVYAGTGKNGAY